MATLGDEIGWRYMNHAGAPSRHPDDGPAYECTNVNCTRTHDDKNRHIVNTLNTNRTNDDKVVHHVSEKKVAPDKASNHISPSQPWVDSMDDNSLLYYFHRETRRVNELNRNLEVSEDFLRCLEKEVEKRALDVF